MNPPTPRHLFANRNYFLAGLLVDELARSGVRHAVICPGSRSTPLTMTFAADSRFKCWSIIDERSAAFFALGIGKATGIPAAVVCTSGTAASNLAPAVAEASNLNTPLILLTADRPHELRDTGANQAIDQLKLFGSQVRWFHEVAPPEVSRDLAAYVRGTACRAVMASRSPAAGPVHLNFPFRDPLVPAEVPSDFPPDLDRDAVEVAGRRGGAPYVSEPVMVPLFDDAALDPNAEMVRITPRGVILAGYIERPPDVLPLVVEELAAATGYPVLAEPSSGLRAGPHPKTHVVAAYDALLRDEAFAAAHQPDLAIRIGAITTSKVAPAWLDASGATQIVVAGDGPWSDPTHRAAHILRVDPLLTLMRLAVKPKRPLPSWWTGWRRASEAADAALAAFCADAANAFEGSIARDVVAALPDGASLFSASSMPIRDLEAFVPTTDRAIRFMANRGANGIDGVTSTALGVAAVSEGPVVLLTGDVAFLHDLGALLTAKRHGIPLTIVVVNNNGGGIFSYLPQAAYPDSFEEFFTTPHGVDLSKAAELFELGFERALASETRGAVNRATASRGPSLVEVTAPPIGENVDRHREAWGVVAARLRSAGT